MLKREEEGRGEKKLKFKMRPLARIRRPLRQSLFMMRRNSRPGLSFYKTAPRQSNDTMLTESFIASVGTPDRSQAALFPRDAGIFIHEFQPLNQQKSIGKKSATPPNCLAVSDDHVFAAQLDKAVVHVYDREKINHQATVPFTERITCIKLVCGDTVLVLGTAEGRILLWELCTGRQVTTAQAHLQAVTFLAVDATSNFLLTASEDSTVHLWSIPNLLSFDHSDHALAPKRTFSSHRAEVSALSVMNGTGFGTFAVSAAKDRTCLIWDFHTGSVLRTYLLPEVPTCTVIDSAGRAVYVGYENGTVQQLRLYDMPSSRSALQGSGNPEAPIQPPKLSIWSSSDASKGSVLSITLSLDSCTLLTGHQSGLVLAWDVATGRANSGIMQNPLPGPVNNLSFLPISGLSTEAPSRLKLQSIIKPKFGAFDSADGSVPGNYALTAELKPLKGESVGSAKQRRMFEKALHASSFPQELLDDGLAELSRWQSKAGPQESGDEQHEAEDFMALDEPKPTGKKLSLEDENAKLRSQLESMKRLQMASFDRLEMINAQRKALLQREQDRLSSQTGNGTANGVGSGSEDESMDED